MKRILWREEDLQVDRVVVRRRDPSELDREAVELADKLGLGIGHDDSIPQPGDFWIGCHPEEGWGDSDPQRIGWVSSWELPVALAALRRSA